MGRDGYRLLLCVQGTWHRLAVLFYARKHAENWLETWDDGSGSGGHLSRGRRVPAGGGGRGQDAVRENYVGRDVPRMLRML